MSVVRAFRASDHHLGDVSDIYFNYAQEPISEDLLDDLIDKNEINFSVDNDNEYTISVFEIV